jgi:hypothetical protein
MEMQSKALTPTSVSGYKVLTSATTDAPSSETNGISSISLSQNTYPLIGKKFLAGVNIVVAGSAATAGVKASTTLTIDDDVEDATLSTNPHLELTDMAGLTRTYYGVSSGAPATATFDFDDAAMLNEYITLTSYFDGVSATVSFRAAAQGTPNGSTLGGYTLFAKDDADTSGAATSAYDAAQNLAAAINHSSGLPYLEAFNNQVSPTDTTLANGRVSIVQRDVGTGGNTAIAISTVTAATATIIGTAALDDEDGTDFILRNADASTVTLHTDPTKNFGDTSSDDGDHRWILNTRDISGGSEVRKATQALWIACKTAIDAGELDMTITPSTVDTIADGSQVDFLLTQTTSGSAGNTAITLVTGVTASGETAFTGGTAFTDSTSVNPPAAFTGGTAETVDITKNQWGREGSAEHAAESLKDAINSAHGHGYVTSTGGLTAARTDGVLTITSDVVGAGLNDTGVVYNKEFQNICSVPPNNFSSGTDTVYPTLEMQGSIDGTNWSKLETITTITDLESTGMKQSVVDLTSYEAIPFLRMAFNAEASTIGTSVTMSFKFVSV